MFFTSVDSSSFTLSSMSAIRSNAFTPFRLCMEKTVNRFSFAISVWRRPDKAGSIFNPPSADLTLNATPSWSFFRLSTL